jgi:hypothetical protein
VIVLSAVGSVIVRVVSKSFAVPSKTKAFETFTVVEFTVVVVPLTVKSPESISAAALTVPVNVGPARLAFRSSAVCPADDTGLFASDVLSTFARPTSVFVIPVGVLITGEVKVLFVRVSVPASVDTSASLIAVFN